MYKRIIFGGHTHNRKKVTYIFDREGFAFLKYLYIIYSAKYNNILIILLLFIVFVRIN